MDEIKVGKVEANGGRVVDRLAGVFKKDESVAEDWQGSCIVLIYMEKGEMGE